MPVGPPGRKDLGSNPRRPDSRRERRAAKRVADSAAPAPRRSIPEADTNANRAAWSYFTVVAGLFGSNSVRQLRVRTDSKKAGRSTGRLVSGLVGEVLRGRRSCCLSITTTRDYSAQSSLVSLWAGSCRPLCSSSGGHPRGGCQRGLLWSCWFPPACPCPAR